MSKDLEVAGKHILYREEMERKNETCDGCNLDFLLIHGKGIPSFFKVLIGKHCLQVLIFPPEFARSVAHLTDQETYLEDSSGRRWKVTVSNHNGSLAIREGWPNFSSEHGLNVGDFLVFHYVPDQHFIVQIFGTSDCDKKFRRDIRKGKERVRTHLEETTSVELLQTTDTNPVKKKSKTSAASESGKVIYKHREEYAHGNEKVINSVPADSGDAASHNAVSYLCLLEVDGQDFLELPECWRKHLMKRAKLRRWIIFLRGPDKRIWPTLYHSNSGLDVLTCGWKKVTAAYGMNPGDECLFQLANQQESIFDIRKISKSKSKMPTELLVVDLSCCDRNEKGAMPASH